MAVGKGGSWGGEGEKFCSRTAFFKQKICGRCGVWKSVIILFVWILHTKKRKLFFLYAKFI